MCYPISSKYVFGYPISPAGGIIHHLRGVGCVDKTHEFFSFFTHFFHRRPERESNPRMAVLQTASLPLRHPANILNFITYLASKPNRTIKSVFAACFFNCFSLLVAVNLSLYAS